MSLIELIEKYKQREATPYMRTSEILLIDIISDLETLKQSEEEEYSLEQAEEDIKKNVGIDDLQMGIQYDKGEKDELGFYIRRPQIKQYEKVEEEIKGCNNCGNKIKWDYDDKYCCECGKEF